MDKAWFAGVATRPHLGRCVVASVVEDSPAYAAGLRIGDVVTEIDLCPVNPDNIIAKYNEVRQSPAQELVFTVLRDSGETEQFVVEREPFSEKHFKKMRSLFCEPAARTGGPSWRAFRRFLADGDVKVFVVCVDAGFELTDQPELFSRLKSAAGFCEWKRHLPPGKYCKSTVHCVAIRATAPAPALHLEQVMPALPPAAMGWFALAVSSASSILPAVRSALVWDEASTRVTRDASWLDVDVGQILADLPLSTRDESGQISSMHVATTVAQAIRVAGGDGAEVDLRQPVLEAALAI